MSEAVLRLIWGFQYVFVALLLCGIVAFVVHFWRVARKRDKEQETRK